MRILLVCNYAPDAQQSMRRFGEMLSRSLPEVGRSVSLVQPSERLGRLLGRGGRASARKWVGYLDKYVLFPPRLARRVRDERRDGDQLVVHVVDHSNAVYVPAKSEVPWVVTCHDLLAVRGALGEDTDCPASWLGRRLQGWIVRGLGRAAAVACDSTSTLEDLQRIVGAKRPQARRMIPLALNHAYSPIDRPKALSRLHSGAASPAGSTGASTIPWAEPFLLHVGSNLARKNKSAVIRVLGRVRERWAGNLVFCGPRLPDDLLAQARAAGLADRVFALERPDEFQLEAAYNLAHALVFPSKCEGFGWPLIEAQACGCPVICSDRTSLPEVGGDAALVFGLEDEMGMADAVVRLADTPFRKGVVDRGFANLRRYRVETMVGAYLQLYAEALVAA